MPICLGIYLIRIKKVLTSSVLPLGRTNHLYSSLSRAKARNYNKASAQAFQFPFSIRQLYLETLFFLSGSLKYPLKNYSMALWSGKITCTTVNTQIVWDCFER